MITYPTVKLIARPQIDWIALNDFLVANGKPSVEESIRSYAIDNTATALVEASARVCYDSYGRGRTDIEDFITNLLKHRDGSVFEHISYTFAISGISRSLSHELVRHRAGFAYSQRSQRFVDESDVQFVMPPLLLEEGMEAPRHAFEEIVGMVGGFYAGLADVLDSTVSKEGFERPTERRKAIRQTARAVLPNAAETKLIVTGNVRAWRHFIEMRGSAFADAEIHRLALIIHAQLEKESPLLFGDFHVDERGNLVPEYSKV